MYVENRQNQTIMKALRNLFILTAGLCLAFSCDDDPGTGPEPNAFEAEFTVFNHSDLQDRRCGDPPYYYLTMKGNGTSNRLGNFTTSMNFCDNYETGYYWDLNGWFLDESGDTLYIKMTEGQILSNAGDNSDYYQFAFNDKYYFNGGTGKYRGASGDAMTNAFVHDDPNNWHTDFFSEGTLILPSN